MVRAVLHPQHPPGLAPALASVGDLQVYVPQTPEEVLTALRTGAPILITWEWDDLWLDTPLEWVQAVSAGVEQFPAAELHVRGVRLTSARGVHAPSVAEHALALLLALTRGIGPAMRDATAYSWRFRDSYELSGRTMGILGLGAIGEELAIRAAALGMRVIGMKRDLDHYDGIAIKVYGPDSVLEVCEETDVVVAALPLTEETRGIMRRSELEAIGEGWFVNVGRGSIVDEQALIEVLRSGPLLGAGLDVFDIEPLPRSSPLWQMENVVLTPHSAWVSDRVVGRLVELIKINVQAYLGRGEWANIVA